MYITAVPNRSSPPAILLRESYRQDGKVKTRTICNLSDWPKAKLDRFKRALKAADGKSPKSKKRFGPFQIVRNLPYGHVAAILGVLRQLGLEEMIAPKHSRQRDLAIALIVSRVLDPASKLATLAGWHPDEACHALGHLLKLGTVKPAELYEALDWLGSRQQQIEDQLAAKYLKDGAMVLYDLTSTYYHGRCCPLAEYGYSRDQRRGLPQINFGLLCNVDGAPIAMEVVPGSTSDAATVAAQVDKIRQRFGLGRVIMIGDRGMLTEARIREDLRQAPGMDWVSALRSSAIRELVEQRHLQPSFFDDTDLVEISSPEYPGERLIACRNPLLAEERARKRQALLNDTEKALERIAARTRQVRSPLRGAAKIGLAVGAIMDRWKMAKHFLLTITDEAFTYQRDEEKIAREAALDGLYVIRTSVPEATLSASATVLAYKGLSKVERAFRTMKTMDLRVRPIYHHLEGRVKAHLFLCQLAYLVEWRMRELLKPLLNDDEDLDGAMAERQSAVQPAQTSKAGKRKKSRQETDGKLPVSCFRGLIHRLGTQCLNLLQYEDESPDHWVLTKATRLQEQAYHLLGVEPKCSQ